MRCLVTGGAGFIGSNLVDGLVGDNHIVAVWDNLFTGKRDDVNPRAHFINCDITKSYDARKILMDSFKPDVVFHLAAFPRVEQSIQDPLTSHDINVNGTLRMLRLSAECGVKRFVLSSTSAVYGEAKQLPTTEECELNPMSPYALHKLVGEQYCKLFSELYDIETVCLRYSNVYGEGQPTEGAYCNVMGIFEQQKERGDKLTIVGDGKQRRDFVYVGDVVAVNIKVGTTKMKFNGDIFNIGSGKSYSVNQIAQWIGGETTNIESRIEPKETLLQSGKANFVLNWETTMELEKWIKNR
jgi:UDP-glucose 4-epimerase